MRTSPLDYQTFRRKLRKTAERFHQRHPDESQASVCADMDTLKTFQSHQRSTPTYFNRALTVLFRGDDTAGRFEPDTVLVEEWIEEDIPGCVELTVRIVQPQECEDGFYLESEMVGWTVKRTPWVEMREWCKEDRGIKIVRHKLSVRDPNTNIYELVFEAPGSREEFLMRWRAPQ